LAVSGSASTPIGFRVDGMYNNLSGKSSGPDLKLWTVNGNLVFALPGGTTATPYLIGGGGWYNTKTDEAGAQSTNNFGLNAGIGARFALSGFSTFAEVRFHNIFGKKDEITGDRPSLRLIPLTFGILF
jgi:opacity protein-like surface antigen